MIDEPLFMRPKNWWRHQHYQDGRSNKWIKNFLDLDEPGSKFAVLSLADQGRLQKLWRLAAHLPNGCIPLDEKYIRAHLGDKRFPIASHLVTNWFAVGTQMELKKAAQKEKRSSKTPQKSTLDQRSKTREVRRKPPEQKRASVRVAALVDESLESGQGRPSVSPSAGSGVAALLELLPGGEVAGNTLSVLERKFAQLPPHFVALAREELLAADHVRSRVRYLNGIADRMICERERAAGAA